MTNRKKDPLKIILLALCGDDEALGELEHHRLFDFESMERRQLELWTKKAEILDRAADTASMCWESKNPMQKETAYQAELEAWKAWREVWYCERNIAACEQEKEEESTQA